MLELRDVRAGYGRVEVLRGVGLSLAAGEVLGMIGPNGAGKTSVLRAICGLLHPSAGRVLFEGEAIVGLAPEDIVRRGLSLVPERRQIFKTLTVAENLELGGLARADSATRIEQMLKRFPILHERAGQRADRLSGGEQQQLAIARALLSEPKLLILDEPSLGLAPKMIDVVYELMQGLREEGVTMLLVEQNAARTIAFSDRCVVLSGGRIHAEGTRAELQHNPDVLHAYLGGQP